jgi:hypothetical protein
MRFVSHDPAISHSLVPKNDSSERNLPDRARESGGTLIRIDCQGRIPSAHPSEGIKEMAISPDKNKVKFIDKIKKAVPPLESIRTAKAKLLSPTELHQLYAGTSVPAHRYLSGQLNAALKKSAIVPEPSRWLAENSKADLSNDVTDWLCTSECTDYEQLTSIGLDAPSSRLTGVVRVKQRSGYLGGPLTAGSREFVAFWVDWGYGFQYEGTTSVAVHDFSSLPAAGLEYKVFLPVDVRSRIRPGNKGAKRVNVRAVLSWNAPPSAEDSSASAVWGNKLDSEILIAPSINISSSTRFNMKYTPTGFCLSAMS